VDVFDLDRTLVSDYASFARSFTQIRARDIRHQVDAIYASERFWPEPLITVNPHYERGASVDRLVADGLLHSEVARVFRVDGQIDHPLPASDAGGRKSFGTTKLCSHDRHRFGKVAMLFYTDYRCGHPCTRHRRGAAHACDRDLSDERARQQSDGGTQQVPRPIRLAGKPTPSPSRGIPGRNATRNGSASARPNLTSC
jgi:hypothetical protein